jgi:uncharacterized protein
MGLIDFHAHLAPTEDARDRLLSVMEEAGISQAVVVAGGVLPPERISRHIAEGGGENINVANEKIFQLCQSTQGRLFPFYFANPYGSVDEYENEGRKFFGLKLAAVIHGVPVNDERNLKFVRIAQKWSHPVYLHCLSRPGFDLKAFCDLALRFPEVKIVLGHGGIGNCDFFAVDAVCDLPNVYFETSGPFSSVVTYAAEKLGAERILFGTEYPLQSPFVEISKLIASGLSPDVLNRNARRILHG